MTSPIISDWVEVLSLYINTADADFASSLKIIIKNLDKTKGRCNSDKEIEYSSGDSNKLTFSYCFLIIY